jgi:hypothetical protein
MMSRVGVDKDYDPLRRRGFCFVKEEMRGDKNG